MDTNVLFGITHCFSDLKNYMKSGIILDFGCMEVRGLENEVVPQEHDI